MVITFFGTYFSKPISLWFGSIKFVRLLIHSFSSFFFSQDHFIPKSHLSSSMVEPKSKYISLQDLLITREDISGSPYRERSIEMELEAQFRFFLEVCIEKEISWSDLTWCEWLWMKSRYLNFYYCSLGSFSGFWPKL